MKGIILHLTMSLSVLMSCVLAQEAQVDMNKRAEDSGKPTTASSTLGEPDAEKRSPRIVNIINFIRQSEPRIDWISPDVPYNTVVEQVNSMKTYNLRGTFLLQYDVLMDVRYQKLLKALPSEQFEIGAW